MPLESLPAAEAGGDEKRLDERKTIQEKFIKFVILERTIITYGKAYHLPQARRKMISARRILILFLTGSADRVGFLLAGLPLLFSLKGRMEAWKCLICSRQASWHFAIIFC